MWSADVASTQHCGIFCHAQDCLDMAERATPEIKTKLHEMAELWLALATQQFEKASQQNRTSA